MIFKNRCATSGLLTALLLGFAGCSSQTPKLGTPDGGVVVAVSRVEVKGPLSLDLGAETTYTATVTDATGNPIAGATVSWQANGTLSLSNPGQTQAVSVKVKATGVGPGALTATEGGQMDQVIVNVSLGSGGTLTVVSAGAAPLPTAIAVNQAVSVKAQYGGMNNVKADAKDATWAATGGACSVTDAGNGLGSVTGTGMGTCTVTATAMGKTASAMFDVVNITAVKVTGDQTALKLGSTRMLTAVALSGTTEVPSVQVTWSQSGTAVVTLAPSTMNGVVTVTGTAVGPAMLTASAGAISTPLTFAVEPVTLLAAATTRVLMGGGATVTVTPMGTGGVVGRFAAATGVTLAGATGFATVGPPTLTADGLVTFDLGNATANSPSVTASFGTVTSNALAFVLTTIQTVTIGGPDGAVRVGSSLDLTLTVKDAQGMTIAGGVPATWADATGVLSVPTGMTAGFTATANIVKLGVSALVATVRGVSSAPYAVPGVPGSVSVSTPSPASVPVGGASTIIVSVLDAMGAPITGVPATALSMMSGDTSKVTIGAGVAAANNTVQFTATAVALAPAPGVTLTATWTGGTETVMSAGVQLVVAAGTLTWTGGACTASPIGARAWRVSGFTGATGTGTVIYDVFAAPGAAATTASTKVAMDGAAGVPKDVTVASIAADWRFGVVARAADGATSALVACTRGATVASSTVASDAIVLGGSAAYADDTSMAVAATNPAALLMVAPATSTLDRTAPRLSLAFGGGLVGVGIGADGTQIIYKRPGTGTGADASVLPAALAVVKTDASNGVCTSRGGITAFELAGATTPAGALTSFALYTSTATATGDVADCALNVLAFRGGATKTIASGVDRVAAFGDHRLGYTYGGALFDVDVASASNVPRQLAADGLDAGSLIAAANATVGAAGAIEAAAIFVLSPTGVVSRYAAGAPPLAAPVASVATASLAGADGLVASSDGSALYVTVGGVLKVVTVMGAGPLTLVVTARDYSPLGALSVTLGSSAVASP